MMLRWWFSSFTNLMICVKVKIRLFMSLETRSTKEPEIVEVVTTSISDDWLTIFTHDKASIRWY